MQEGRFFDKCTLNREPLDRYIAETWPAFKATNERLLQPAIARNTAAGAGSGGERGGRATGLPSKHGCITERLHFVHDDGRRRQFVLDTCANLVGEFLAPASPGSGPPPISLPDAAARKAHVKRCLALLQVCVTNTQSCMRNYAYNIGLALSYFCGETSFSLG